MKQSRGGFSVVEALIGAAIIVLVLLAANSIYKPINKAARKAKMLNTMMKVENMIREGIYTQATYTDANQFEIRNGDDLIAKHGQTIFLNEDLSPCNGNMCDLQTNIALVDFNGGEKGVIYRIAPTASSEIKQLPLGVPRWPETVADQEAYMVQQDAGNFGASSSTIVIPPALVNSEIQKCESGFIRGFSNGNQLLCWNFVGDKQCPRWSVPVGYRIDARTSTMQLLCQKLNTLSCPPMSLSGVNASTGQPITVSLDNFYSLNKLVKSDLYPPRAASSAGASECKSIVNFTDSTIATNTGIISAAAVAAKGGQCPDKNLYQKLGDGTCAPHFNPNTIATTTSARISPQVLQVLPANEMRAVAGESQ